VELPPAVETVVPLGCDEAIRKIFPANVATQALQIRQKENGLGTPDRKSGVNRHADGKTSIDHGCLQINDYWHFGSKGWTHFPDIYDAEFNATIAYQIYKDWGNSWCAWTTAKSLGYCTK